MRKVLSLAGIFMITCLVGIGLSGMLAQDAGACWDCSGAYRCDSWSTCSPVTPRIIHTICADGCCPQPEPYVVFECSGRCTGNGPWCDCIKVGCWEGLPHIPVG